MNLRLSVLGVFAADSADFADHREYGLSRRRRSCPLRGHPTQMNADFFLGSSAAA
jgi:hypothetical protein